MDEEYILNLSRDTKVIITVEEHSIIGGLGSAVAEILCESETKIPFKRLGIPSEFPERVGDQDWFLSKYKLNPVDISNSILKMLNK